MISTELTVPATGSAVAMTSPASAPVAFNYETDVQGDAAELRSCEEVIGDALGQLKKASLYVVDIGAWLAEAKTHVRPGKWGVWLGAKFNMVDRSAQRYMRVHRYFGRIAPDILSELDKGTLYALAENTTPAHIRDEIVKRLEAGEFLTDEEIDDAVEAAKAAATPKPKPKAVASKAEPTKAAIPPAVTLDGNETTALRLLDVMRRDLTPEQFEEHARLTAEVSPAFRKVLDDHEKAELDRAVYAAEEHEKAKAADEASDEPEIIEASAADEIIEPETVVKEKTALEIRRESDAIARKSQLEAMLKGQRAPFPRIKSSKPAPAESASAADIDDDAIDPAHVAELYGVDRDDGEVLLAMMEKASPVAEAEPEVIDDEDDEKPEDDVIEELDLDEYEETRAAA